MGDAVDLRGVRFAYDGGRPMLCVEEMRIAAGRRVFLHGPSGSGKTTLLSLIAGVLVAQAGSVRVLGEEMGGLSAGGRDRLRGERMGYIFQGFNLIPYLTVAENIALPCRLHTARAARIEAATVGEEVRRIARRLDMEGALDKPVTRLSTGQQQRVAIARAVIGAPALVIADEPTSALDTDRRDAFLDLLMELTAATTLLFVSHDRGLARHFDEVVELGAIAG